jgi:uncharacterized protein (DUF362 family)
MAKTRRNEHGLSRRDFLRLSGAAASAVVFGGCEASKDSKPPEPPKPDVRSPRSRGANVFVNGAGMPILVCVTGTDIQTMLAAGLSSLGGLNKLIGPGQNVLIKPNCNASEPYPAVSSVQCIISLIDEAKKVTSGTVSVGDQGYESSTSVYKFTGLDPGVGNAGGNLLTLSSYYLVRRNIWPASKPDFRVYADIYDAPVVINACVLKRHHTAIYSCALKNNVGAVAGPGAAFTRRYLHYESGDFMGDVAEIAGVVNPDLNIVDARSVLTRGGPSYQAGVVVETQKLVLCGDIVATDAYCAEILAAHDPEFAAGAAEPTLYRAENLGMGTADLSQVQIIEITA